MQSSPAEVAEIITCGHTAPRATEGRRQEKLRLRSASFYTAPNPPFGATITYHLKEALKPTKAARREQEQKLERESRDVFYPGWDTLKAEDREDPPAVILTIRNAAGQIVRRLAGPVLPACIASSGTCAGPIICR